MYSLTMDVDTVVELLAGKGVSSEVVENFRINKISGQALLRLSEEDLKELAPLIGERIEVRTIIEDYRYNKVIIREWRKNCC